MQTNEDIGNRFLMALDALYAMGEIKSFARFERESGIPHTSLHKLRSKPACKIMQVSWLAALVENYSVNAEWLLLGRGRMFL
jgi:hypothetical protein